MFIEGGGDEGSGNKIEFINQPDSGKRIFFPFYNISVSYWLIEGSNKF